MLIPVAEGGSGGIKGVFLTLDEIQTQSAFLTEDKAFYNTRAHITHVRTDGNLFYPACHEEKCGKKLTESGN